MNLHWKIKKNDNWGCEILYCGKMKVASYYWQLSHNNNAYTMSILLPIRNNGFQFNSIEQGRNAAEAIVKNWFKLAME